MLKAGPKSVLRYPGGKSRAVKEITKYIPDSTTQIASIFMGGGSIELACANKGVIVHGYDNFKPLVDFWQCLLQDPKKLAKIIESYYPLAKPNFYNIKETIQDRESKYQRAAMFFVINRSSFSGTTLSGGMSPGHPRFTKSSIERVKMFKIDNLTVECVDFKTSIKKSKDVLLYLDPPYMLKNPNLYGKKGNMHKGFDHKKLAQMLKTRNNWILSYNDIDSIRNIYSSYSIIKPQWGYSMSKDKKSKEILILSHNL